MEEEQGRFSEKNAQTEKCIERRHSRSTEAFKRDDAFKEGRCILGGKMHSGREDAFKEGKDTQVRNVLTLSSVCPWLLLEVMAKHTLTGNCFLVNSKGSVLSSGLKGMRGIINWFPLYGPMASSAMITELFSCFTKYLAPLTCPFPGSKLRRSMIGDLVSAPEYEVELMRG